MGYRANLLLAEPGGPARLAGSAAATDRPCV
jgi:hypothetical protein